MVAVLALGLVCIELWLATTKHDNSRDQHLGGAVAFAQGHIDLMRPMILGFNANGVPTPLEFPIWQACTAVLMKCFGVWYGWGNVTSIIFFFSSLWALFDLCRRTGSSRLAWWAVLFSFAQPLSLIAGGQAGADSTAWTFAMWFIYFAERMFVEKRWLWWGLAVMMGSMSATTKAPFFMTAGLTTFFWLWIWHRKSARAWAFLVSAGVISSLALFAWNHHCQKVYKTAEFPLENLDALHGGIYNWYLGTMAFRLNPHNWLRFGWHVSVMVFGGFTFVFLLLVSIRLRDSARAWLWLLAASITTLVFPILLFNHHHYLFIFTPAVAWLCAIGATEIEPAIWNLLRASIGIRTAILFGTFIASLPGWIALIRTNLFDSYNQEIGELIQQHTLPDDKIVVWGDIWGRPFLRANRDGVTGGMRFDDNAWFNDPKNLKRLKELGYKEIVLMNPSPFEVALTSVNGGDPQKPTDLHQVVPSVATNWPVVFDSPQLLILRIPD